MKSYTELEFEIKVRKCPICGEELVIIDNMNYITSICPKCFSTVFEELFGDIHIIKNGKMKDGYDTSMDVFIKQMMAHGVAIKANAYNIAEIRLDMILGNNIYDKRIFNHFYPKMKKFKIKNPCIYWDGYEKYLDMSNKYFHDTCPELF